MSTRGIIKRIWGLAKKGLNLTDDDLYSILYRETGKESMKECKEKELKRVVLSLEHLRGEGVPGRASRKQIWKIKDLARELGWEDNPRRLAGFLRKWYGVEQAQWLSSRDAWKAIESLKNILERERAKDDGSGQDLSDRQ